MAPCRLFCSRTPSTTSHPSSLGVNFGSALHILDVYRYVYTCVLYAYICSVLYVYIREVHTTRGALPTPLFPPSADNLASFIALHPKPNPQLETRIPNPESCKSTLRLHYTFLTCVDTHMYLLYAYIRTTRIYI